MKLIQNKYYLLIEQLIFLVLIEIQIILPESFFYREIWSSIFLISIVFLNTGYFISIFLVFKSTLINQDYKNMIRDFNCFLISGFYCLLFLNDCQPNSEDFGLNYSFALTFLFLSIFFGYYSIKVFKGLFCRFNFREKL